MATTTAAVATRGLTKRFGRLVAVMGLDLAVEPGQVFGFLGLNGAGKTTSIRMLLDLLRPSAGRAAILGHDCQSDGLAARALVGYMPGEPGFYRDMTGRRVLDVLARLSARAVRGARQRELLERLSFPDADLDRRVREYSTGMKRKLAIVSAFQADAPLLILDEPTEGLDPLMQEAFYALLADVRRRGTTVFLSSHVLSEVDRVCDRIAVLRTGELVLEAPVEQVRRMAPRLVRVAFREPVAAPPPGWPDFIEIVGVSPDQWSLRVRGSLGPVVDALAGLPVADLDVREPRLEDVVLHYYRGEP
ncbi:MAG TPA: ABC transporter ATP-binding protein [Vicinamibacterales bacterium]|nr:ABC transporter ATP-binding protein [Vicinamibacterales bacterium]